DSKVDAVDLIAQYHSKVTNIGQSVDVSMQSSLLWRWRTHRHSGLLTGRLRLEEAATSRAEASAARACARSTNVRMVTSISSSMAARQGGGRIRRLWNGWPSTVSRALRC